MLFLLQLLVYCLLMEYSKSDKPSALSYNKCCKNSTHVCGAFFCNSFAQSGNKVFRHTPHVMQLYASRRILAVNAGKDFLRNAAVCVSVLHFFPR